MKNLSYRILLYAHTGSANRGCEAIIRSTAAILRKEFPDQLILNVASMRVKEDLAANIPAINRYIPHRRNSRCRQIGMMAIP